LTRGALTLRQSSPLPATAASIPLIPVCNKKSRRKSRGEAPMKRTVIAAVAATLLGTTTLAPAFAAGQTPINNGPLPPGAWPLIPIMLVMSSKEDKNFKAVNPYEKRMARRHHHRHHKHRTM
jgi:hypothetical protein